MDKCRIMVSMEPGEIRAIDDFSARCRETNGRKLSRACIVRAMTRVASELDINVDSVQTGGEFVQRVWEAIARRGED